MAHIDDYQVLDLLTSLVDKSLVVYEEDGRGAGRYRLLETVRQYAAERLAGVGEQRAARDRHRDFFLSLAERDGPLLWGPEEAAVLARLEAEHDNLSAALDWAQADPGGAEAGLRLAGALRWFWFDGDHEAEGRRRLEAALARGGGDAARAGALCGLALLKVSEPEAASEYLQMATALFRRCGDRHGEAYCLSIAGAVAEALGDPAAAHRSYSESLALSRLSREAEDRVLEANNLLNLGRLAWAGEGPASMRPLLESALAISHQIGDRSGELLALGLLGDLALDDGAVSAARSLWERSLAISREIGSRGRTARGLVGLAAVALAEGDPIWARGHLERALMLYREMDDGADGEAWVLSWLARTALAEGVLGKAREHLMQCWTIIRPSPPPGTATRFLQDAASLALAEGAPRRAARLAGAAQVQWEVRSTPLRAEKRRSQERLQVAVQAAVGDREFAAAWAAGRAMTLDQALAHALLDVDAPEAG